MENTGQKNIKKKKTDEWMKEKENGKKTHTETDSQIRIYI